MEAVPRFLSGIFPFRGAGLERAEALGPAATYRVPDAKRSQLIYFRAGNSGCELACLTLRRDGVPLRLFPIGARGSLHVPLAVVEDLFPGTEIEVAVSAPAGTEGHIVLDVGFLEI